MSDVNEAVEAAAVEAVETKAARDVSNGVTRPKDGTKTGRVWAIADKQAGETGKARRKDVLTQCEEEGLHAATAATQYGRWRKYNGLEGRDEVEPSMVDDGATEAVSEAEAEPAEMDAGIESAE